MNFNHNFRRTTRILFGSLDDDINTSLKYSIFFMFADDLKLFEIVKSVSDCEELQSELNSLVFRCERNGVSLNISKSFSIRFSKSRNLLNFTIKIMARTWPSKLRCNHELVAKFHSLHI